MRRKKASCSGNHEQPVDAEISYERRRIEKRGNSADGGNGQTMKKRERVENRRGEIQMQAGWN